MMLLGHVIGMLALFGGSILAATAAVLLAGFTGVRQPGAAVVRGMLTEHDFNEHNTHRARPHRAQLPGLPTGPGRLHLHQVSRPPR